MPKAKRKKKPDRMSGEYQRAVGEFVGREVYYCASMLIHELAQKPDYMDELLPVLSQDDYESAAREANGRDFIVAEDDGSYFWRDQKDSADSFHGPYDDEQNAWQDICSQHNIEPYRVEAYEHWIISDHLAARLEEHGEMILRDFLGLTLWGRTTTGQAIAMDGVICNIYDEMMR